MKLRFSSRAIQDLGDIGNYLHARNPAAARRVRATILASLENLTAFPRSGRRQHVEGVRKLVLSGYPYLIYYTIDETKGEVVVVTIQHAARRREFENV